MTKVSIQVQLHSSVIILLRQSLALMKRTTTKVQYVFHEARVQSAKYTKPVCLASSIQTAEY